MMKHEFEDRVGVTVSAYEYANIESAYMACDEDKDTFCKRWVKEGGIKKLQAERLTQVEKLQEQNKCLRIQIDSLYQEIDELKAQLDAELDWSPCEGAGTNYPQDKYIELVRSCQQMDGDNPFCTPASTRNRIAEEFGFTPDRIILVDEACTYEVNRHHILRAKDTFKRSPQYCSTDYNYARFNVICTGGYMQWEMVDGELREYES